MPGAQIFGGAREGQAVEAQRPREVEVAAEFERGQRVHVLGARAPCQQIGPAATEFARARSRQR